MKLAILGGSFNPIHLGHLFLADAILSELHYDRVALVPAYRSPFKLAAVGMEDNARDRLEMIAASIAGDPRLTVDDCEIRGKGFHTPWIPSRTLSAVMRQMKSRASLSAMIWRRIFPSGTEAMNFWQWRISLSHGVSGRAN